MPLSLPQPVAARSRCCSQKTFQIRATGPFSDTEESQDCLVAVAIGWEQERLQVATGGGAWGGGGGGSLKVNKESVQAAQTSIHILKKVHLHILGRWFHGAKFVTLNSTLTISLFTDKEERIVDQMKKTQRDPDKREFRCYLHCWNHPTICSGSYAPINYVPWSTPSPFPFVTGTLPKNGTWQLVNWFLTPGTCSLSSSCSPIANGPACFIALLELYKRDPGC